VKKHQDQIPVSRLCRFAGISRSGFYEWRNRKESTRDQRNGKLLPLIRTSFLSSRRAYGALRVREDLQEQGETCGKNRVARLMRLHGLRSVHRKKYRVQTTQSNHCLPIADNVIAQDFTAGSRDEKWGGDITYIPTREGFVYLATILDFYSRKIVGFSMSDSMTTELCTQALQQALITRQFPKNLIHHSDRGSPYASVDYRRLLQGHHVTQSMSRRGNCYDNAMVESFFHTLKVECVYQADYVTKQQAKEDISNYIHHFYNARRRHSSLDYLSPVQYESRAA
jgi:transposase InsO family protein